MLKEFKGSQLLQSKKFRLAQQLPPIETESRRALAQSLLEKGKRSRENKSSENPSRAELTAHAQASILYASNLLDLCRKHQVKVFASIIEPLAPRGNQAVLRKDFAYLFE